MADVVVLICDWHKEDGRTELASEVVKIERGGRRYDLALCTAHAEELMRGAAVARRGRPLKVSHVFGGSVDGEDVKAAMSRRA